MKADLHVHSRHSDGSQSIEEILINARQNGLTHISFVDHDTVEGYREINALSEIYGINAIPGIEISAFDFQRKRKVHILGYHYRPEAEHIKAVCEPLLRRRHAHSLWQIKRLKDSGVELDEEAILEKSSYGSIIYKQHIMQYLTDAPFTAEEYKHLYQSLFKGDGPAAGEIKYIDVFDAVRAIVLDGGIAVVAHPGQLDSYEIIPELTEWGLGGIERNHPDHSDYDFEKIEKLANRYNLIMTGGSDYHGEFGESIEIGDIVSPENSLISK